MTALREEGHPGGVWEDPTMAALRRETAPPIVSYLDRLEAAAWEATRATGTRHPSMRALRRVLAGGRGDVKTSDTPGAREGRAGAPPRRSALRGLVQAVERYRHHPYIVAAMDGEEPPPRLTWEDTQQLPLHEVLGDLGDELHAMAEALEDLE